MRDVQVSDLPAPQLLPSILARLKTRGVIILERVPKEGKVERANEEAEGVVLDTERRSLVSYPGGARGEEPGAAEGLRSWRRRLCGELDRGSDCDPGLSGVLSDKKRHIREPVRCTGWAAVNGDALSNPMISDRREPVLSSNCFS